MLPNLIGMIGVVLVLAAYALVSTARWKSSEPRYQWLNLFGTALVLYSLMYAWNLPSVLMQCAWIVISIIGLARYYIKKRRGV